MDYEALLELAIDLACDIQHCGAETYRVEDTVTHFLRAYGLESEVFVIPNCIIVSIETPDGKHLNRMRRSTGSVNDLDGVERFSGLCRRLCQQRLPVSEARRLLEQTRQAVGRYSTKINLLGHLLAAAGFTLFFGGTVWDVVAGGLCGLSVGACNSFLDRFHANAFFKPVVSGFVLAFAAYILGVLGVTQSLTTVIVGTLMLLVPGLLFTNSIRDVIYGDSLSGINRLVQVMIIAVALAVGTGAGAALGQKIFGTLPPANPAADSFWLQILGSLIGSTGFCLLFNIHGPGMLLCLAGDIVSWSCYTLCVKLGCTELMGFFIAAAICAIYAEAMARVRRCPATPYLVVALFPLIPGSAIYHTMAYAVEGQMESFLYTGTHTAAIAGALAAGILLVSTTFRMWSLEKFRRLKRHTHN